MANSDSRGSVSITIDLDKKETTVVVEGETQTFDQKDPPGERVRRYSFPGGEDASDAQTADESSAGGTGSKRASGDEFEERDPKQSKQDTK